MRKKNILPRLVETVHYNILKRLPTVTPDTVYMDHNIHLKHFVGKTYKFHNILPTSHSIFHTP